MLVVPVFAIIIAEQVADPEEIVRLGDMLFMFDQNGIISIGLLADPEAEADSGTALNARTNTKKKQKAFLLTLNSITPFQCLQ